jgi:hypothetical protein
LQGETVTDDKLWIPKMCETLVAVEKKTHRVLRGDSAFFIDVYNDALDIAGAIGDEEARSPCSLTLFTLWGLFKEIHWFHTIFLSGNYPLLNARLRFVWELMYRATLADLDGPPDFGGRIDWLQRREKQKNKLGWNECIGPLIRRLFPLAIEPAQDEALKDAKELWDDLNGYVHPSVALQARMCDNRRPLHTGDHFDVHWAKATLRNAQSVFDLVWLATLKPHAGAIEQIREKGLNARYPIVEALLNYTSDGHPRP